MAKELAEKEYDRFHQARLQIEARQADEKDFECLAKKIESNGKGRKQ